MSSDVLLTVPEAARDVLRCHPNTAYQLVADGTLPCVRVGRSIRIPRAALTRWIREHTELEPAGAAR